MSDAEWPDIKERFQPLFLARLVWRRKYILVVAGALGILLGLINSMTTPASYQIYMVVGPAEPMGGGQGRAGGLMGDLAAISGINISSPGSSQLQRYRLLMTGTRVAALMERRHHVLRQLIPTAWNDAENRWKRQDEISLGVRGAIKEWLGMSRYKEPNDMTLSELLRSSLTFTDIRQSDFTQVFYRTANPEAGVRLLEQLHRATNEIYMQDLAAQTTVQIDYIDRTLRTETRENVRAAQMRALDQYANQLISLHSGQSLFVQYIQPPVASSSPIWPKPSLMIMIGAIIGGLAGLVAAILWPLGLSVRHAFWDAPLNKFRSMRR
jgi:uncharacterized protein involved in exopolysaccharide biosynthesis